MAIELRVAVMDVGGKDAAPARHVAADQSGSSFSRCVQLNPSPPLTTPLPRGKKKKSSATFLLPRSPPVSRPSLFSSTIRASKKKKKKNKPPHTRRKRFRTVTRSLPAFLSLKLTLCARCEVPRATLLTAKHATAATNEIFFVEGAASLTTPHTQPARKLPWCRANLHR